MSDSQTNMRSKPWSQYHLLAIEDKLRRARMAGYIILVGLLITLAALVAFFFSTDGYIPLIGAGSIGVGTLGLGFQVLFTATKPNRH